MVVRATLLVGIGLFSRWSAHAGLPPGPTEGASEVSITAASCNYADVAVAIRQVPAGGSGTVIIPQNRIIDRRTGQRERCDWGTGLVVIDDKARIRISGPQRGQPVIRRSGADDADTVLSDENPAAIFTFDCSNGQVVEFANIQLEGRGDATLTYGGRITRGLELRGHCRDFKVHGSRFSKFGYAGVLVKGVRARGVIYDNTFQDNWRNGLGYGVAVMGWNSDINHQEWPPLALGTADAVFIEDNFFSGQRHNVASGSGSRYVFRHNDQKVWRTDSRRIRVGTDGRRLRQTFWDGQVDAHGVRPIVEPGDEVHVGSRSWEIYDNTFVMANDVFKEDVDDPGTESQPASIHLRGGNGMVFCNRFDRGSDDNRNLKFSPPSVSFEDQESCADYSYPAPYQVGYQGQSFFWSNSGDVSNGGRASLSTYEDPDGDCRDLIRLGRDYFNRPPNQVPSGGFANYKRYPYPHPLRSEPLIQDGSESLRECLPGSR